MPAPVCWIKFKSQTHTNLAPFSILPVDPFRNMSATAPSPLNVEAIVATIDDTCARWSQGSQWNVRRARDAELVKSSKSAAECNLFGIVLRLLTDEQQVEHMASFYLAYSTWDGRVLYVDRMNLANTTGSSRDGFIVLADIAVKLKCAR